MTLTSLADPVVAECVHLRGREVEVEDGEVRRIVRGDVRGGDLATGESLPLF